MFYFWIHLTKEKNWTEAVGFLNSFNFFSFLILKKRLQRSVTKMETGLDIRIVTEHGQITLYVITAHMKKWRYVTTARWNSVYIF